MLKCFPLHELNEKNALIKKLTKQWRPLDVEDIRHYFGEYIAIYYAWLLHYTYWLIIPSAVGIIMFIVGCVIGFDNNVIPYYCVFIVVWVTFYLEFWKRRNSVLVTLWDEIDFTRLERVRPSFHGEIRKGVYVDGEFLPLSDNETTGFVAPTTKYSPASKRYVKFGVGGSVLCSFIVIVIIVTLAIFSFRFFLTSMQNPFFRDTGAAIAGIMNAIFIMIGNFIYRKVAFFFTEWENHRTESEWENSFIIKNAVFQFVNSYTSLFYIAFVKSKFTSYL